MSSSEEQTVKKRNRLTLSCTNCKKRKVKCNRGRPCSSCIRYKVGHNCVYPDAHWVAPVNPANEPNGNKYLKNNFGAPTFSVQRFNSYSEQPHIVPEPTFVHKQPQIQPPIGMQNQIQANPIRITTTPPLQSELEMLKSKIKEIEASLQGINPPPSQPLQGITPPVSQSQPASATSPSRIHNLPNQSTNQTRANSNVGLSVNQSIISSRSNSINGMPPIHNHTLPNHFSPTPNLTNYASSHLSNIKDNVPIQLPPINWKPTIQEPTKSEKKRTGMFPGVINWHSLKFNPNDQKHYIGANPYTSDEETLDLYSGYSPIHVREARRMNYGPFSWLSIMKKDDGLLKMLQFMMSKRFERLRTKVAGGESFPINKSGGEEDISFRMRAMDREGFRDLVAYGQAKGTTPNKNNKRTYGPKKFDQSHSNGLPSKLNPDCHAKSECNLSQEAGESTKIYMNKHAITQGLTFYEGKMDQELHLIEQLRLIIPKQKVIWLLINKFFKSIYPYMPFVDEEDFKKEMHRIIGPEGYMDKQVDLKVEKRLDFAYMGILLFILRLVYLSLLSNKNSENEINMNSSDEEPKAQELKYLLNNPITINIVDMAKLCLDQFDLFQKSNLVILQCALLKRIYNMCSPEDGDGADGGDSQIFNGTLIQVAYSIGINREPDKFEERDGKKTNNLIRKMWYYLVASDIAEAYQYGNPTGISRQFYDTKLPYYEPGNENCADNAIEQNVISTYSYFEQYYIHTLKILKLCLNIQTPANIGLLVKYVSDFETLLDENYGTISQFLTPFDSNKYGFPFIKVLKCRNYIHMKSFLNIIFFQLYLHYELKNQQEYAYFYLKKGFVSSSLEFLPELFKLIFHSSEYFGESAEMILNPVVESLTHKTNQMSLVLMLKINCEIYTLRKNGAHRFNLANEPDYKLKFVRLLKVSKILEILTRYGVSAMSRLSNRYYYAWKITKAHTFLLNLAGSEDFHKFFDSQGGKKCIGFSLEQVTELLSVSETSLNKISKLKFFHKIIQENKPSEIFGKIASADEYRILVESPRVNEDMDIVNSAHSHSDSISSSVDFQELEEFQTVENPDIDRLWYQMANLKNGTKANGNTYENYKPNENVDPSNEPPIVPSNPSQVFSNEYGSPQVKLTPQTPGSFYPDAITTPMNQDFFNQFSFNPVFDIFENFPVDPIFDNIHPQTDGFIPNNN